MNICDYCLFLCKHCAAEKTQCKYFHKYEWRLGQIVAKMQERDEDEIRNELINEYWRNRGYVNFATWTQNEKYI